jgi:hypothetical protein
VGPLPTSTDGSRHHEASRLRFELRGLARGAFALAAALGLFVSRSAQAFVYPEHRDIGTEAVSRLQAADRTSLEALWKLARPAFRGPMCAAPSAGEQGLEPSCIDFAALPAIAGDHSCSPKNVVVDVLPSSWILDVARVGAETKAALASAESPSAVFNRSATMNLDLQSVDPEYLSRAGGNSAHFLLARESDELGAYIEQSVRAGAPVNGLGLYLQYHVAAIQLARELAEGTAAGSPRAVAARDVIALETFALHWLEDAFASGHAAGTWGADAWRKGTHDYYCEHGLDMTTWGGERMTAFGDSHMRLADRERASRAASASVSQVLRALVPGDRLAASLRGVGAGLDAVYSFDSCRETKQPRSDGFGRLPPELFGLVRTFPMAGRGADDVHLARFRQEFGLFSGAFGSAAGSLAGGGTGSVGVRPSVELAAGLRFGYAAPDIVGTVGTAKAFLEAGLVMQSSQVEACQGSACTAGKLYELFPRVPSRTGLRIGARLPFYVVPGDLLVLAPVLALVAPRSLPKVGITAMRGGLVPYERSFRTRAGTFQLIVGREVDLTFFGYLTDSLQVRPYARDAIGESAFGVYDSRSVRARVPVLEWTPIRSFATNVTFAVPVQIGAGLELPLGSTPVFPTNVPPVGAGTSWDVFVRVQLDAQYYFGEREDAR